MPSISLSLSLKSQLLTGVSESALSAYAVAGFEPELVFDFKNELYRTGGSTSTFSDSITYASSGNKTMVDSDGLLKWAPHNATKNSTTIGGTGWTINNGTITASQTDPDNGTDAVLLTGDGTGFVAARCGGGAGGTVRCEWIVKAGTETKCEIWPSGGVSQAQFDLSAETATATNGSNATIESLGDGWYLIGVESSTAFISNNRISLGHSGPTLSTSLYLYAPRIYRSDLGGMVNNPDRGDSYVPTTSSAVYLPRRGHHVYNGSEWVNEGLLVESEPRTQLLHTTDALVTQSHTVTAVPHTLHFTGTGTVTLSGASTAGPLVGTGTGEENRVYLTFTPTAASLTLTVSGTVTDAQLEVGSTPSSYIPNLAGSGTVLRAAESLTVPAAKLPWPTPNVIGPELVTNGDFELGDNGDWTLNGTAEISSGTAKNLTGGDYIAQGFTTEAGKYYQLTFDALPGSNTGNSLIRIGTGPNSFAIQSTGLGSTGTGLIRRFVATGTTTWVTFYQANFTSEYDNISVREIDPLALSIQMQGRMTYAEGSAPNVVFSRRYADANNYIDAYIRADGGRSGQQYFRQVEAGTSDSVNTGIDYYSPGINVPYNIASRHGSTFINGSVDGTALTEDTDPVALPDLETTDLDLAFDYMGTVKLYRMWADDLGDSGTEEASVTSPLVSGSPTITGEINDPDVGETLTAVSAPVVIGTPTPSTTWQWLRDGASISGATSSTYTLVNDDVGSRISVKQTETNAGGSDSATSAETAIVTAVPATAIQERDGDYILDRSGNYIEVRA